MGGGEGLNIFEHEEQKVSSDLVDQVHRVLTQSSLYSIVAIGTFVYVILMYIFLARDHVHIQSNPEVQWHLKRIKEEEEDLIEETKERYKEEQRKRRIKRRAWYRKYRQEKLDKMDEKERQRILDKEFKKREERLMMERQLYRHALSVQSNPNLSKFDRKLLKKMVKQDVKKMRQYTKEDLGESSSEDEITRTEDKIYYGSDSDTSQHSQQDDMVLQNHKLPSKLRNFDEKSSSELSDDEEDYIIDDDQIYVDEYYDEEGESEYYDEEDEVDLEDTMEMAFEETDSPQTKQKKVYEEEKKQSLEYQKIRKQRRNSADVKEGDESPRSETSEDSSLNTSQSSEKSTKVIEFDEDGNILEGKKSKPSTLEMTDLKARPNQLMREFVPAGKVNQSQKKREKRKLKKMEEERKKKIAEEEAAKKAYEKAKKEAAEKGKAFEPVQRLKKKVLPKQVIHDMEGDWEVVDKKKTVFVENDSDSDEEVEEEEKIQPRRKGKMNDIHIN